MAGRPPEVDVHHHFVPDFYKHVLSGVDLSAKIKFPSWSPKASLAFVNDHHIDKAILSLSAPGAVIAGSRDDVRGLVRKWNDYASELCSAHPNRFGFFTALLGLEDLEGAISEIHYVFRRLKADGPLVDYRHEPIRTASDLVLSGRKRQFPNCKVILSHARGTLLYLADRISALATTIFDGTLDDEDSSRDSEQVMADLKSFYFDLALGGSSTVLDLLINWAPRDHVLYGFDLPFAGGAGERWTYFQDCNCMISG
ncbi:MAG: hypothetical protein LQ349_003970 [Xanthoria aureola]|nr:MAG: hypothetical protein LQ349_003970 [Xanthoria aureola]